MRRWFLIPLVTLLFVSCSHDGGVEPDPSTGAGVVTVRYGTYFGKCTGYCIDDMTIDRSAAVLVRSSHNSLKFPAKEDRQVIGGGEWHAFDSLARLDAMLALDSDIGCPEGASGGREGIVAPRDDPAKRGVFAPGATIPAIAPLVERARALRATFKD